MIDLQVSSFCKEEKIINKRVALQYRRIAVLHISQKIDTHSDANTIALSTADE